MPLARNQTNETIESANPSAKTLAEEIAGEIKNAIRTYEDLPKEEKKTLTGGLIGLITILALSKSKEKSETGEKTTQTTRELTALKESIDDGKYKTDGYDDDQIMQAVSDEKATGTQEKTAKKSTESEKPVPETTEAEIISLSPAERIVRLAELAVKNYKTEGEHCWDWVNNIYMAAGCVRGGNLFSYVGRYEGKDCGNNHATEQEINKMKPGDHIIYNNKNNTDKYGNHSVIFIRWIDRAQKIAEVASYYAAKNRSSIFRVNLEKSPVTAVFQPVSNKPVNLAYLNVKQKKAKGEAVSEAA
jgi:hypothetical protein